VRLVPIHQRHRGASLPREGIAGTGRELETPGASAYDDNLVWTSHGFRDRGRKTVMISTRIMHDSTKPYRGRFAPSPTGPLHFGSLIAAVGSYLEARRNAGAWLVRMEDLDRPREATGAADAILRCSRPTDSSGKGASCGRAAARQPTPLPSSICGVRGPYFPAPAPGGRSRTPRSGTRASPSTPAPAETASRPAVRRAQCALRVGDGVVSFEDKLQGVVEQNLATEIGDFVIRRADGVFAYQLAVVVDDFEQGVTDVVRGADLLASTPRQILLQRGLGYPAPQYVHLPVAVNRSGEKLSKQTLAAPLDPADAPGNLRSALRFLGQEPPAELESESVAALWSWALTHWRLEKIPRRRSLFAEIPGINTFKILILTCQYSLTVFCFAGEYCIAQNSS